MFPVIVLPVLNEAELLRDTCRSLGFGSDSRMSATGLIVVDNGSTDGTLDVIADIRRATPGEAVVAIHHGRKGAVSARMAGTAAAEAYAGRRGMDPDRTLILQADADTFYEDGYVETMRAAAAKFGRGFVYEGSSVAPPPAQDPVSEFRKLEALVDAHVEMPPEDLDVIVDDKVAGFLLADYQTWGGHRRERQVRPPHDEVLAETTRLLVRARCHNGARRVRVEDACATTSSRRIIEDPAFAFATAGFPREKSWKEWWNSTYTGARILEAFRPSAPLETVREAVEARRRHCEAMFTILPKLVATACDGSSSDAGREEVHVRPADMLDEAFRRAGVYN